MTSEESDKPQRVLPANPFDGSAIYDSRPREPYAGPVFGRRRPPAVAVTMPRQVVARNPARPAAPAQPEAAPPMVAVGQPVSSAPTQDQVNEVAGKIGKLRAENEGLKRQMQTTGAELLAVRAERDQLRAENDLLRAELEQARAELEPRASTDPAPAPSVPIPETAVEDLRSQTRGRPTTPTPDDSA